MLLKCDSRKKEMKKKSVCPHSNSSISTHNHDGRTLAFKLLALLPVLEVVNNSGSDDMAPELRMNSFLLMQVAGNNTLTSHEAEIKT